MQLSKKDPHFKFIIFATSLLLLIFIVENINKHFWLNDFKVYYSAAQAFMHGEQVYGIPFALGSGYYKYSPFTSLLFVPYALLPFKVASIIHYFVLSFVIISLLLTVWRLVNVYLFSHNISKPATLLSIAFVCTLVHLVRELHLGNINVVLLLLLCFTLLFILESKMIYAGVLLAIVIITKPFLILLLIPLVLRKHFKPIFSMAISLALFMLIPAIFIGISGNIALHKEWLSTILEHNAGFPSNNTIESILRLYLSPDLSNALPYILLAIVCIGSVFFFFTNQSFEKKNEENSKLKNAGFIMEWFILIALMPSLFKTDTQHFLLSLPLVMMLIYYLTLAKNNILIIAFVILMWMYGGNLPDLLGKAFSTRLEATGILGISNLIIIITSLLVYFRALRTQNEFSGNS